MNEATAMWQLHEELGLNNHHMGNAVALMRSILHRTERGMLKVFIEEGY